MTLPRDESSDESTIISSQTSTLTRKVGPEAMMHFADDDVDDADYDVSDDEAADEEEEVRFQFGSPPKDIDPRDVITSEHDATRAKSEELKSDAKAMTSSSAANDVTSCPIRRSQTFTHNALLLERQNACDARGNVSVFVLLLLSSYSFLLSPFLVRSSHLSCVKACVLAKH